MKRSILILALLFCLCLCACAAPARETTAATAAPAPDPIWGTWLTTIDCSKSCNSYILETKGAEIAEYFDFTGISVAATLTLQDDGTFTMTISQEAVAAYTQEVERIMQEDLHSYLEQKLQEKLDGRTLDQYLRAANVTMEDLLISAGIYMGQMTQDLLDQLRGIPCSGTYYRQDGLLYIAGTVCAHTLTENTLLITAPEDTAGLAPFPALFPLEFTR